jgi:hypothetical protein
VLSQEIRVEVTEVLGRPQAGSMTPAQVDDVFGDFWAVVRWRTPVEADPSYLPVVRDPKDVIVLRTAMSVWLDGELATRPQKFIVSDNTRHFRTGVNWAGFRFLTANIYMTELGRN